MNRQLTFLTVILCSVSCQTPLIMHSSWAQENQVDTPQHRRDFERPAQIMLELYKVRSVDLPKLREVQKLLGAMTEPVPVGNARDVLGEKIVRSLNRVALSKLATRQDTEQALKLWTGLFEESRAWKPPFSASRPNHSKLDEVDGLHAAALKLVLEARGEAGRAEARQALAWLTTLQSEMVWWREQRRVLGERMLATPDIVPEVREWVLAFLAAIDERTPGFYNGRIKLFRELVALPHLSPASRATHLRAFASFLQSKPKENAEAQLLWGQIARDESVPVNDRCVAYSYLFRGAAAEARVAIANEVIALPKLSDEAVGASTADRATMLALFRGILPVLANEAERKVVQEVIARLEG